MEYSLILSQEDLVLVLNALGNVPLANSLNAFNSLHAQMKQQDEEFAARLTAENTPKPKRRTKKEATDEEG